MTSIALLHPYRMQWVAFVTLLMREVHRFSRMWSQTVLPPVMTMMLYFAIFGHVLGAQIGDMHDLPYLSFIAPGFMMMAMVMGAYNNVVSSVFTAKFHRSIDDVLIAPVWPSTVMMALLAGGILRAVAVGIAIVVAGMFFTTWTFSHPVYLCWVVIFSTSLFSMGGLLNGMFAKRFDDVAVIPTFILTPLTYLGGVFYDVHALSPFWKTLSLMNPVYHIITLFRYAMVNVPVANPGLSLLVLVFLNAALFAWVRYLWVRGKGLKEG